MKGIIYFMGRNYHGAWVEFETEYGTVVIEKRESAEQAFILRGENGLIKNEQLILPIRIVSKD